MVLGLPVVVVVLGVLILDVVVLPGITCHRIEIMLSPSLVVVEVGLQKHVLVEVLILLIEVRSAGE